MNSSETSACRAARPTAPLRGDVAIVGMACMYPQALGLGAFWQNVVSGVDAVTDMPPERVPATFCDPESTRSDRTYCRRAGFLGPTVPFDPAQFGVMPILTDGGDPEQLLALKVAHEAIKDAGYDPEHMDGARTEVVIGRGNYANRAGASVLHHVTVVDEVLEMLRTVRPDYTDGDLATVRQGLLAGLPRFGPDVAASLVPNFTTGRVANRFDLMGTNFTVDAACASSLIALEVGVRDLLTDKCDLALAGGVFIISDLSPMAVLSQVNALSRRSEIRPFDRDADGTILGEGVGILVLKRLEDARHDGNRIYAIVKGVGTSSDGRALGLLAPRVEGEELALRRAYEMAGIDPATIGLIEAHGTATPTGDAAEIEALTRVFGTRDPEAAPRCAIGTIKSMIGHPLPAAGAAGLIKAALALHYKVFPPTLHCEQPNPKLELEKTPFYINGDARPWVHAGREHPRRAGVSAFGFGGVNAHVILEEYRDESAYEQPSLLTGWPTEVCILEASDRAGLLRKARELANYLSAPAATELKDLASTLNTGLDARPERLTLVAESIDDLRSKLERASARLADPDCSQVQDASGVYYFSQPLARSGKLALLFPGFGPQYVGMLGDLCVHFPIVRQMFDLADYSGAAAYMFPPPGPHERDRAERRLWSTVSSAFLATVTANAALYALFQRLGLRPDAVVGHSGGELNACVAAGTFPDAETLLRQLSHLWGVCDEVPDGLAGTATLAVGAEAATALARLGDLAGPLSVVMDNCPHQVVLAGPVDIIGRARERLQAAGIVCERLPFNGPYHTEAFSAQLEPVREGFGSVPMRPPAVPIYSCASADLYPPDVAEIRRLMVDAWCRPVRFQETIRKMYDDGVRLFLELGPGGSLTAFVDDILPSESRLAICADSQRRHGLTQLNHVVALLSAHGVSLSLDELYARRSPRRLDLAEPPVRDRPPKPERTLPLTPVRLRLDTHIGSQAGPGRDGSEPPSGPQPSSAPVEPSLPVIAEQPARDDGLQQAASAGEGRAPVGPQSVEAAPLAISQYELPAAGQGGAVNREADGPMVAYLQVMEQFLAVQQSVMQAFLLPATPANGRHAAAGPVVDPSLGADGTVAQPPAAPGLSGPAPVAPAVVQPAISARHSESVEVDPDRYPLLGRLTSYQVGHELRAERVLSLETDPFLLDHMFARRISADPALRPLAVLPTTVSMEIMAEAAAALVPGLQVVGMRRIRSLRWINVTERPTILRITARRVAAEGSLQLVEVAIWSSEAGADASTEEETLAAQALVLIAADYPAAPTAGPFPLKDGHPCDVTPIQLYEWLFHGPQFQAIRALHEIGDDGLSAELAVLPLDRFLGACPSESLILDPVVLDGAGQLSAAWLLASWLEGRLTGGGLMYPVEIDEVTFYGQRYRTPTVLPCHLRLLRFEHRHVRADMEIIGPDGRVHIRILGWHHYRVHWPANRMRAYSDSRADLFGELWEIPTAPLPSRGNYVASLVDGLGEKGSSTMEQACAYIVLSAAEREQWRALQGPTNRRAQWLLGRAAVKDAARTYLSRQYGLELYPADVEVTADARGRPRVHGAWAAGLPSLPAVSLAHTGLIGVAIAGGAGPDDYLGIDIERIRPRDSGFMALSFSPHERAWLEALDEAARWEWATRFWCAKEALAKAVGHGLVDGPTAVAIEHVDWATGRLELELRGTLARSLPDLSDARLMAYTAVTGELAVASTACEKAGQAHGSTSDLGGRLHA